MLDDQLPKYHINHKNSFGRQVIHITTCIYTISKGKYINKVFYSLELRHTTNINFPSTVIGITKYKHVSQSEEYPSTAVLN
jgi:hypothetical protein